jgi:hypothetical protein
MEICVVCNQPWPKGLTHYSQRQQERQSKATGAHNDVERALTNLDALLLAAQSVRGAESIAGGEVEEEERERALDTLLNYARGEGENIKEKLDALWEVTAVYLWAFQQDREAEGQEQSSPGGKEGEAHGQQLEP